MTSSTHLTPTLIHLGDQMQKTKRITTFSSPRNNNYSEENLGKMNKPSKKRRGEREKEDTHRHTHTHMCTHAKMGETDIERKKANSWVSVWAGFVCFTFSQFKSEKQKRVKRKKKALQLSQFYERKYLPPNLPWTFSDDSIPPKCLSSSHAITRPS